VDDRLAVGAVFDFARLRFLHGFLDVFGDGADFRLDFLRQVLCPDEVGTGGLGVTRLAPWATM
jgi:hypothetical protein